MTLHHDVLASLRSWTPDSAGQRPLRESYLGLLLAREDAVARTCVPGHITASVLVVSPDLTRTALVLHPIGGAWFQPGGHLEATDATLLDAARREVREETGLEIDLDPTVVHLDCHPITCRGSAPSRHFDVRFVGVATTDDLTISHESDDLRWWNLDEAAALSAEMNDCITAARVRLDAFVAAGRRWGR